MKRVLTVFTVLMAISLITAGMYAGDAGSKCADHKSCVEQKTSDSCCPSKGACDKQTTPKKSPPKKAPAKKVVSAVCPVMKNKIPDVTKAAGKSVYKGKTYYFCCSPCKPAFDKNPEKYLGTGK
jgi:YHS domain-containing protein